MGRRRPGRRRLGLVAPPTAQTVGDAFVAQYYKILHHSPSLVHQFYQDISQLGRPEEDGTTSITTTMTAINEKVLSLHYDDYKAEIKSVDAQESLSSGVNVLVTGYMTGKDNTERNFTQFFFLAPQDKGDYFVLNDMFQYVEKVSIPEGKNQALSVEVEIPITTEQEQVITEAAPVKDDHITEQTNGVAEEANGDVHNPFEDGKIVEATEEHEEEPVAEVKDLKGNSLPFSSPPPAPRKTPSKSREKKVNHTPPTVSKGYSIYIKGLPYNATPALLEDEFKKFGAIKNGGIQVRSKQGICFGFVEFEEESAVHDAVKASRISLGGRPAVIEEKRSTNSFPSSVSQKRWTDSLPSSYSPSWTDSWDDYLPSSDSLWTDSWDDSLPSSYSPPWTDSWDDYIPSSDSPLWTDSWDDSLPSSYSPLWTDSWDDFLPSPYSPPWTDFLPSSSSPPAPHKTPSKSREEKVNQTPPTVSSADPWNRVRSYRNTSRRRIAYQTVR